MKTGKPLAVLIALITIWPLIYTAMFFISFFAESSASSQAPGISVFGSFETMMTLHLLTMLVMIGVAVFYIVHAFKNDALTSDKRILWVIVLLFGGIIAAPIYWFHYVWRTPAGVSAQESRTL